MTTVKPVLCVGCTVIDFVTVNVSYPKEDSDRRCLDGFWQRGGNASNVSTVLRLLGAKVEFFGKLSKSDGFRVLLEDLRQRDICVEHCPMTDQDPPFSSVIIAQDTGSRTIVHCNKRYPYVSFEDFSKIDLNHYGWVHFEARNAEETIKMISAVHEHNKGNKDRITISLDFESLYEQNLPLASLCDYVVLSKDIATKMGWKTSQESCTELVRALQPNCPTVICPWGKSGAACIDVTNKYFDVPAFKLDEIVDTLGAGDCFMAGFIYGTHILKFSLLDAVKFANQVAGHKITKFGYDHIAHLQKPDETTDLEN